LCVLVIGLNEIRKFLAYRVAPKKSKPLPNDQKIVLKPVIEIKFVSQIKV